MQQLPHLWADLPSCADRVKSYNDIFNRWPSGALSNQGHPFIPHLVVVDTLLPMKPSVASKCMWSAPNRQQCSPGFTTASSRYITMHYNGFVGGCYVQHNTRKMRRKTTIAPFKCFTWDTDIASLKITSQFYRAGFLISLRHKITNIHATAMFARTPLIHCM